MPSPDLYTDVTLNSLIATTGHLHIPLLCYRINTAPIVSQALQQYLANTTIYMPLGSSKDHTTLVQGNTYTGNKALHPGFELSDGFVSTLYLLAILEINSYNASLNESKMQLAMGNSTASAVATAGSRNGLGTMSLNTSSPNASSTQPLLASMSANALNGIPAPPAPSKTPDHQERWAVTVSTRPLFGPQPTRNDSRNSQNLNNSAIFASASASASLRNYLTKVTYTILPRQHLTVYPCPTLKLTTYITHQLLSERQRNPQNPLSLQKPTPKSQTHDSTLQLITHYLLLQLQLCLTFWDIGTRSIYESNQILRFLSSYYDPSRFIRMGEDDPDWLDDDGNGGNNNGGNNGSNSSAQADSYSLLKIPPPTINIHYTRFTGTVSTSSGLEPVNVSKSVTLTPSTLTTTFPIVLSARVTSILTLVCSALSKGYPLWAPYINNIYDLTIKLHYLSQLTVYPVLAQQALSALLQIGQNSPRIFLQVVIKYLFNPSSPPNPGNSSYGMTGSALAAVGSGGNSASQSQVDCLNGSINPSRLYRQLDNDFVRYREQERRGGNGNGNDRDGANATPTTTGTMTTATLAQGAVYTMPYGMQIVGYTIRDHTTIPTATYNRNPISSIHLPNSSGGSGGAVGSGSGGGSSNSSDANDFFSQRDQESTFFSMTSLSQLHGLITPTILHSLTTMLHKFPDVFYPYLPTLAQLIIRILDPQQPTQRKSMVKHTTLLIHSLVTLYPNIAFDKYSQRLLVGSATHQVWTPKETGIKTTTTTVTQRSSITPQSPSASTSPTTTQLEVFSTMPSSSTALTKQQQLSLQQYKDNTTISSQQPSQQSSSLICYDLRSAAKVKVLWDKTSSPVTACGVSPLSNSHFCATYHAFEQPSPILKLWSLPSTSVLGSLFHSQPKCVQTYTLPKVYVSSGVGLGANPAATTSGTWIIGQQLDDVLRRCKIRWEMTPQGKKMIETVVLTREDGSVIRYVCKD